MMAQVREVFGQDLPLALLFQGPTLSGLAQLIREDAGKHPLPTLIPIRRTGSKPPLFCVSRPNLNALGFMFLARRLPKDQPVFGLQSHMKEDGSFWTYSHQDYERKASEYIEAMQRIQPNGPYLLTGFCEGAHIAFEMARQLEVMNRSVAMIAILDAWPIENTISRSRFKLRNYARALRRWANMSAHDQLRLIEEKLWSHKPLSTHDSANGNNPKTSEFRNRIAVQLERRYWPGPDFKPPTYFGSVTLFRTAKQDFHRIRDYKMGWGARALGGVDVIPIAGAHTRILREPYVVDLASKMEDCISRALNKDPKASVSSSNECETVTVSA
jgi:thioesterase domain-containing protein